MDDRTKPPGPSFSYSIPVTLREEMLKLSDKLKKERGDYLDALSQDPALIALTESKKEEPRLLIVFVDSGKQLAAYAEANRVIDALLGASDLADRDKDTYLHHIGQLFTFKYFHHSTNAENIISEFIADYGSHLKEAYRKISGGEELTDKKIKDAATKEVLSNRGLFLSQDTGPAQGGIGGWVAGLFGGGGSGKGGGRGRGGSET